MSATLGYDACVLHPPSLRDLLIRLSVAGLVRARLSQMILDEVFRSIRTRRPDLADERLLRTRHLMCEAVPDCFVEGYEGRIPDLVLPDPDDRHVLAAALQCGADAIVTFNLRDFPAAALAPLGTRAIHPDDLLLDLWERAPAVVLRVLDRQAVSLQAPPMDTVELVGVLEAAGLVRSMARIRASIAAI